MTTENIMPQKISDALMAFPASVEHLMPAMTDIPEEFHRTLGDHPWVKWQAHWFCEGLKEWPKTKDGISHNDAQRHLSAIQRSYQPQHQHKVAAVAYLASLWLVEPTV